LVLELISLQALQEVSTNANCGLPSPSLCRPRSDICKFEKHGGQKVNKVAECEGEKYVLCIYVAFHRIFIANNKCAEYAKVITIHVS